MNSEVDIKNKEKRITLFEFFNSKLGIWILGAVFLAVIPFIVEKVALSYVENQRKQERIEVLLTEIEQRLDYLENFNGQVKKYLQTDFLLAYYGFERDLLKNRKYYHFKPIFNEFKEKSLKNLLFELSIIQTDRDMIDKTQELADVIEKFRNDYLARLSDFEKFITNIDSTRTLVYEFDDETKKRFKDEIWKPVFEWRKYWRDHRF